MNKDWENIKPSSQKPVDELPRKKIPIIARIAWVFLFPIIILFRKVHIWYINKYRLIKLSNKVYKCKTREEVEAVIGQPRHVVRCDTWELQDSTDINNQPDTWEMYFKKGCHITLIFKDGHLEGISGSYEVNTWDCFIHDRKRQV